jgi:hypothetical protein
MCFADAPPISRRLRRPPSEFPYWRRGERNAFERGDSWIGSRNSFKDAIFYSCSSQHSFAFHLIETSYFIISAYLLRSLKCIAISSGLTASGIMPHKMCEPISYSSLHIVVIQLSIGRDPREYVWPLWHAGFFHRDIAMFLDNKMMSRTCSKIVCRVWHIENIGVTRHEKAFVLSVYSFPDCAVRADSKNQS